MRFLVDECSGPFLAKWLRDQGHDVFSVYDEARGIDDDEVLKRAFQENRILITNDKDFGEMVFRGRARHHGIVLLRLEDESHQGKIDAFRRILSSFSERLPDRFVVVTDTKVRISGGS